MLVPFRMTEDEVSLLCDGLRLWEEAVQDVSEAGELVDPPAGSPCYDSLLRARRLRGTLAGGVARELALRKAAGPGQMVPLRSRG